MSPAQITLLVVGILAIQAVVWGAIFLRLRRNAAALHQRLRYAGESVLIGPEYASYRGDTRDTVSVKTLGSIILTNRRVVFSKPLGAEIDLPLGQITGLDEKKWFKGSYRGGKTVLVLQLADGREVGFIVRDRTRWTAALAARIGRA